jgi:kynurenine formamidase
VGAVLIRYRDLPLAANGLRHAWAGADDRGTVGRLTDAVVAAAAAEVRTGQRINLSLPLDQPDPPFFGRARYRHRIEPMAPGVQDDVLDGFHPQGSSQWDGLRHRGDPDLGFYGGVPVAAARDGDRLGIGHWAATGITGRAVLADLDLPDPFTRQAITPEDLRSALAGAEVRFGDVLLVRTGFLGAFLALDHDRRTAVRDAGAAAGLAASEAMAEYLWDSGFAAVAVDNPAVEVAPRDPAAPPLHARLIPMLGFALGEFFALDELAAVSRADGRHSCLLVSVPLNLPGGVGSPANAVALR